MVMEVRAKRRRNKASSGLGGVQEGSIPAIGWVGGDRQGFSRWMAQVVLGG